MEPPQTPPYRSQFSWTPSEPPKIPSSRTSIFSRPRHNTAGNDAHGESFKDKQQPRRYRTLPKESEPELPKTKSRTIPPIPPRPPGELFKQSLIELTCKHPGAVAEGEGAAPPDVPHHRVSRGRHPDIEPVRRLGELDLDKRGNAFSCIQPDGWFKVIPKKWVEDEFSDDDARFWGSRSSYSQDDQEVGHSNDQPCALYTETMGDVRPRTSSRLPDGDGPEGLDIWDEAQVEHLVPAPLRSRRAWPSNDKPAGAPTHEATNAASCRSVWSSILCDSDNGSQGADGLSQESGGRTGNHHHTEQEDTFEIYNVDGRLTADIDEILDLYLTPDHDEEQKKKVQVPKGLRQPQWEKIIHIDPTLASPLGQRYIPNHLMDRTAKFESKWEPNGTANRYCQAANSETDHDNAVSRDSSMSMTRGSVRRRASSLVPQAHRTFTDMSGQGRDWGPSPLRERKHTQHRAQGEGIAVGPITAAVTFLDENGQTWI
ncbi:hypothetical protein PV05_10847 [Exophiala xenobiotica]|uniref:Uncharacterized protein n=1 Tax=Exophiala xenobiotica TaxID=348802 RepID=A0A0D2E314_9EURO|nr:uncharacterized protein PV05_10847 [Exophiala xenobiotica]KIW49140.1 hypothetical protein PV05_10847 [Exophiala xenobiotica]